MSVAQHLRYHASVDLVGKGALRAQRLRDSLQLRLRPWTKPHLAPPPRVAPWLRELISRHYLAGRFANPTRKVAWVTSGAPVEFLKALGFYLLYPENHGAVCGIRRQAVEISEEAEAAGYAIDLCSYARTDFGAMLSGRTPVGRLPRPDLLLCCDNICQTVVGWYRVLAAHFRVPLILIDTPFVFREVEPHAVEHVKRQLGQAITIAERVAGRALRPRALEEVARLCKEATGLWLQIIECGQHRPAPFTAFDQFIHMAPIVEMRGDATTVDYYAALLAELRGRIRDGVAAVRGERTRLLWDNLPIWFRLRWLSELLAARGAALVGSTYTNAWGELTPLMDPARPLESGARVYLSVLLNRSTGHKLATLRRMARDFAADGVLLHSDRSCKPYSIGQMDQRERLAREDGIPALLLEADHNDARSFAVEQAQARIEAFLEQLQG